MFYHINEKSALLMSIFRERFCNKEQIKKNSKHLSDEKNLVFLLGMIDWTEDILRFIFNGLHFKTLFYILHILHHRVQNICTMYNIENPLTFEIMSKNEATSVSIIKIRTTHKSIFINIFG